MSRITRAQQTIRESKWNNNTDLIEDPSVGRDSCVCKCCSLSCVGCKSFRNNIKRRNISQNPENIVKNYTKLFVVFPIQRKFLRFWCVLFLTEEARCENLVFNILVFRSSNSKHKVYGCEPKVFAVFVFWGYLTLNRRPDSTQGA